MAILQRKVCMLGSFAVGKTSLVRRYVDSIFTESYTTTIGVKIDKKVVTVLGQELSLVLWDVYGEDSHQSVVPAYLRGIAGYILVVDPTRGATLQSAINLHQLVEKNFGDKPFVLAMNKSDLKDQWDPDLSSLAELKDKSVACIETSAKSDTGVEEMFENLAGALVPAKQDQT